MIELTKEQAQAISGFMTEGVKVRVADDTLILTLGNQCSSEELRIYVDGWLSYTESWGSTHYWDRWELNPDGVLEYTGTVAGHRVPPAWLEVLAKPKTEGR